MNVRKGVVVKRRGRKAAEIVPSTALVTERVRLLIDGAHAGNVHEASKVSGVPSATLRALYSGKNVNPELKTLEALGRQYGVLPGWFSDPATHSFSPPTGIDVIVRWSLLHKIVRPDEWLFFPWASWPLPDVFNRLLAQVVSYSPHGQHPLIAKLNLDPKSPTDIYEIRAAVALFLLAPLRDVELIAPQKLLEHRGLLDSVMVRRLRLLGMFWQDALQGLLD